MTGSPIRIFIEIAKMYKSTEIHIAADFIKNVSQFQYFAMQLKQYSRGVEDIVNNNT